MAERKFDYENISNVYNEMKKITGTDSDPESIAGILHKIDDDVHNSVAVEDESIFGPLGNQLLLDWENTSSDFPNFVNNFSNWSILIAQSADDYKKFEEIVQQRKKDNPLGLTSAGMGQNYIDTSFYKDYTNTNYQQYVSDLANVKQLASRMNEITGAVTSSGTTSQLGNQGTTGTGTGTTGTGTGTTGDTGTQPGNQGAGGTGTAAANSGTGTGTTGVTTASCNEYFIQRGDKCTVDGKNVSFYGRDGSYNYYLDESRGMVCVEENGRLYDLVYENSFTITHLKDVNGGWYSAVNSSNADAAQMGLPETSSITPSNAPFDEHKMYEYVKYGNIDESQAVYPKINESFSEAVNQHQPVIRVAHTVDVPALAHGSDLKVDETGYVTFIYDDRSGKYYRLETDGTYQRGMYGYDPSELSSWSIE